VSETARAEHLLADAEQVLRVLRVGARRAYVLEVTGTPKAGKTSTLGLLHAFFRRAGFRVHTLRERAGDCPIKMKGHFFFNAWTTCTMLAEVLATYDTDVDIIVLDRGFLDALIWLSLQVKRGQVTRDEAEVFERFVLLERWRSLVDLTVVMTASPRAAMDREANGVLVPRTGSMMNEGSLAAFNGAVAETIAAHENDFEVIELDTTQDSPNGAKKSALDLLEKILPRIRAWAEQHVIVLPRAVVQPSFASRPFVHGSDAEQQWQAFRPEMRTELRHEIEQNDDLVQLVGCGILVHEDKLFVLTRATKDEKSSYGRSTLWKGCHIEGDASPSLESVAEQVRKRVLEELHLKTDLKTTFLGLAWLEGSTPESRHLGVMFSARIDDEYVAQSMQDKEFRKAGRGHLMTGTFQAQHQILRSLGELGLEPWSQFVVQNIGLKEPA
jgi:predicted NUDIX family phosphoesterase